MTTIAPATTPPAPAGAMPEERFMHPGLRPDVAEERLAEGRVAEFQVGTLPPGVQNRAPAYFEGNEALVERMQDLAGRFPQLVRLETVGVSSDRERGAGGHDILAIRLGNQDAPADRPSTFWIAGQHAREIANPAMVLQWAEETLERYGTDPEATALLDTREVNIIPMMNPDGRDVIEHGYERRNRRALLHRKNTTPPDGTDLNRNFDFLWGGTGASSSPFSQTYRGASAASEAEVRAVQDFARETSPGLFIDWHSFSELVLYPWGHTRAPAPDNAGLRAVAERFAAYNHYSPRPSVDLYPTTGTSKDFMYGELGIPAFTMETGRTFHMDDRAYGRVYAENAPVMSYAAKIADAPYERAQGPDALDVHVDPGSGTLQATLSGRLAGDQAVAGAEAVLDPFAPHGSGVPLAPIVGDFGQPEVLVQGDLSGLLDAASGERQLVYVRGQSSAGSWGPATAQWLTHPSFAAPVPAADASAAAGADGDAPPARDDA